MKSEHQLELPRRLQIEFSRTVQTHTDGEGGEIGPDRLWEIFSAEYLGRTAPLELTEVVSAGSVGGQYSITARVKDRGTVREVSGEGNGPLSSFVDALSGIGYQVRVLDYAEHALASGGDALAAAYVECEIGQGERSVVAWGVATDANIVTASLRAITSAVDRAVG